eukprot:gb/GECG01009596.1/.p1 GENE.gb/GECG01009596.1/~~gb/GECG01009596.1/.p1  ORF type:complete len:224 (+),score=32.34 gb/GECG01009596.1/:1-672(+)
MYGSDGSDGASVTGATAGKGQGSTTRAFGNSHGDLYAGGGGGADCNKCLGKGGTGGGGDAAHSGHSNSGGGGGGIDGNTSDRCSCGSGGSGGSGIVIIRFQLKLTPSPPRTGTCTSTPATTGTPKTTGTNLPSLTPSNKTSSSTQFKSSSTVPAPSMGRTKAPIGTTSRLSELPMERFQSSQFPNMTSRPKRIRNMDISFIQLPRRNVMQKRVQSGGQQNKRS